MISIKVPPLGESVVEATVASWKKEEGQAIAPGETLVELETDKITVEVPALKAGVLTKRAKQEGDVVKVDEVLGEMDENASADAQQTAPATAAGQQQPTTAPAREAQPQPQPEKAAGSGAPPKAAAGGEAQRQPAAASGEPSAQRVSPAAQRVAAERGVNVSDVQGTGRGGVVSKPDVVEHASRGAQGATSGGRAPATSAAPEKPSAPQPAPGTPAQRAPAAGSPRGDGARETREKMSTRRRRIAEHLLEAKHATASLTTFNEIDMTSVMRLRERFRESVEKKHGVKLTFMPFFVKATCVALQDFPVLNAQVDGDAILYKHYVNMGIAVASEAGLIVPNIKDADRKGLVELSADISGIARRARDGKITMDDLTGGTFTITNGGVFGSLVSTPILNHPQVGILGLHAIQERPVAVEGQVVIRPMMYVALTYDHRIVDGQQSVQFLVRLKELMEEPAAMLIG